MTSESRVGSQSSSALICYCALEIAVYAVVGCLLSSIKATLRRPWHHWLLLLWPDAVQLRPMRDRHLVLQHGLVELRRWKAPNGRMHAVPGRFELSCLACHCSHGKQQSPFKSALLWTCFGHALDMPSFFRRSFCLRKSLKVSETVGPNGKLSSVFPPSIVS